MIKADLNPEILSTSDVSTLCSGKGRERGKAYAILAPSKKKFPFPPKGRLSRLEINREGMGEGREKIWKLEPRSITINKRRERERENINK